MIRLLLALLLLVLSIMLAVFPASLSRPGEEAAAAMDGGHVRPLIVTILALAVFLILFPLLGLAVTAAIFLAILLRLGTNSWTRVALLSVTIAIGAELACRAMKIPLPEPWISQLFQAGA